MKTSAAYQLSPAWMIEQSGNSLVISGGADARYEVELVTDKPSLFAEIKAGKPFTKAALSPADARVLEQLITAEIIVPVLKKQKILRVTLLAGKEALTIGKGKRFAIVTGEHDLALIVRSNETYAELLANIAYEQLTKPHLFVDLAFHHTVSIGPLVFPGETACIACLQGRVGNRWGDEAPPAAPLVASGQRTLISELVAVELERIATGDTSLVGATFAWNLQDRAIKKNQLLKVPLCPICSQNEIDRSGALALPWSIDESPADTV